MCIAMETQTVCAYVMMQPLPHCRHDFPRGYRIRTPEVLQICEILLRSQSAFPGTGKCGTAQLLSIKAIQSAGPSRGGKGGKVFLGPATFGGPRRRSKILKMVFQIASFWPKICIKSIFGRPRWGSLRRSPEPLVGCWGDTSPHVSSLLDAFGVSISRHTEWGVIRPRDNVFPSPAVALDGPDPIAALNITKYTAIISVFPNIDDIIIIDSCRKFQPTQMYLVEFHIYVYIQWLRMNFNSESLF